MAVRKSTRPVRRGLVGLLILSAVGLLAGCSADTGLGTWSRLGLPPAASDRAPYVHTLWIGMWIAAFGVGALVWGLILWAIFRYRRRRPNEVPRQTRYNLPMEVLYTTAPFVLIGVIFYHTVVTQHEELKTVPTTHTVHITAWRWSWTFNYMEKDNPQVGEVVHDTGTIEKVPTLYLPVNQPITFVMTSPDVIHSFWVPAFYFKEDVIPGRHNTFTMTPTKEGVFAGKCAELCGTYHSAMIFDVKIVSDAEFTQHLQQLKAANQTGLILGPSDAYTVQVPEENGKTGSYSDAEPNQKATTKEGPR